MPRGVPTTRDRLGALLVVVGVALLAWAVWPAATVPPRLIRLVDRLPVASGEEPAGGSLVQRFTFRDGPEGWAPRESASAAPSAGGLLVTIEPVGVLDRVDERARPHVACEIDLDARDADSISIRMSVPSTQHSPRVFWRRSGDARFGLERSIPFAVTPGDTVREFRVAVADHPQWTGRIRELGLWLSNVPGDVLLESVAIERLDLPSRLRLHHPGGPVTKVRVGTELREAVIVLPGGETSLTVDVPEAGELEIGFGIPATPVAERRWRDEVLDVSSLAGRRVTVRLRAGGGGRARWAAAFGTPALSGPREEGPNLILISLDTLRADHVNAYGYPRPTTPHLDRLAAEGVLCADATAHAPHTLASHMSLMTSLLPSFHGVVKTSERLRDGIPTLADRLRAADFRTEAIVEDGYVTAEFGFHRGFERYDDGEPGIEIHPERARRTFARAAEALGRLANRRFFLFVHTYGPHAPYNPPERYRLDVDPAYDGPLKEGFEQNQRLAVAAGTLTLGPEDVRHVVALYDAAIQATDEALGEFLARLEALDLHRETLVVVVSDHGEEFLDHGIALASHGHSLYQELLHVPLVMRLPGVLPAGGVVRAPVGLVDVLPTALGLLGLPVPRGLHGENLWDLIAGKPAHPRLLHAQELLQIRQTAVRAGAIKFVRCEGPEPATRRQLIERFPNQRFYFDCAGRMELFDLAADPKEERNLAGERQDELEAFEAEIKAVLRLGEQFRQSGAAASLHDVGALTRERLKTLGYTGE
jgi:arylsulfatase A-like enzyme